MSAVATKATEAAVKLSRDAVVADSEGDTAAAIEAYSKAVDLLTFALAKGGEKKRFRYKPDGLRKRRNFRGNTINQDTRQINLKVIESGNKSLADILAAGSEEASE